MNSSDITLILVTLISGGVLTQLVAAVWKGLKGRIDREDSLSARIAELEAEKRILIEQVHVARIRAIEAGVPDDRLPNPKLWTAQREKQEKG